MKVVVAIMVFMVAACVQPPASENEGAANVSETESLVGPYWRLVELDGQPSISGGGAREPHLRFSAENRVSGATGCNTLGGGYERTNDRLEFGDLFSTKMACVEENRMAQETRFLRALESVDRFAVSGDTLTLFAGENAVASFARGQ
ncbi:MAG: META domain-containing protein [Gemmatimonadota bacterium]|nr:META domain-containing protein [Gemmatimonadota bacterium]